MTSKNFYIYGLISLLSILSFSLVNRFPIPYELYYYITKVDPSLLSDPLTYSFQLLKTPSYYLIEPFYDYPKLFFWTSFLIDLIFSFVLFFLLKFITKNSLVSLITVFIFSPLVLAIISKFFFDPGFRVIHVFGYGSYIFSTRYIIGFVTLLSIFFLVKKEYNLSLIFYSLSLMSHPSSALLAGLFLLSTFLVIKINFKYYVNFFIASFIGLMPIFIKLWNLRKINVSSVSLDQKEWYLRLLHDEPDDFSLLFQLFEHPNSIIITTITVTIISFFIFKNTILDNTTKKIFYCSLFLPVFYYFSFVLIEFGSVYLDNYFFVDPIIKSQAGYKILKFTYFPMIFAVGIILKDLKFLNKKSDILFSRIKPLFFICLIIIPLFLHFYNPTNFKNKKILLNELNSVKKNNYIDYLNARFFMYDDRTYGHLQFFHDLKLDKPDSIKEETNYFKIRSYIKSLKNHDQVVDQNSIKYNNVDAYNKLYSIIKTHVPEKSSIIILPYFLYLRDVFPNHNFYYLEKPDGNLSLGSKKAASIISERLKDLLDVDHKDLHLNFTFLYSDLRSRYLKINDDKIIHLKNKYPEYKYFMTETGHKLNQVILFQDDLYTLYKIQ